MKKLIAIDICCGSGGWACAARGLPIDIVYACDIAGKRRQMEWQEAADLQGFPRDYVFWGSPSDTCLMVADAVNIFVGRAILKAIVKKHLEATP